MSEDIRLVIRNSHKKHQRVKNDLEKQQFTLPFITSGHQDSQRSEDIADRLKRLQGNLRSLEKQYRSNLKEGFDNKIKAYRLEAVVQRKMFQEALSEMKKSKQREERLQKRKTSQINTLSNSRVEVMKIDRQNRQMMLKQKIKREKRQLCLSLHQQEEQQRRRARNSHDKVLQQAENINIKRDYLMQLKNQENRKREEEMKNEILHNIMTKTQKLRSLKNVLENMKESQLIVEQTFLTI